MIETHTERRWAAGDRVQYWDWTVGRMQHGTVTVGGKNVEAVMDDGSGWHGDGWLLHPEDAAQRACAYGCGLAAEPGDVYCAGCRSAADHSDDTVTVGGIAHDEGLT